MRKLIYTTVFSMIMLCGCVSTQAVADKVSANWENKNFDEFVLTYGAPQQHFTLNSGDIAYTWNSGTRSLTMPATATTDYYGNRASTNISGGGKINMFCELQILTDKDGTIKNISIIKDTGGFWSSSRCSELLKK